MKVEQLEAEVMKLSRQERARLAAALISSLDEDSEIDRAWEEEAELRYQRHLAGEEGSIPAQEGLAQLRAERER